MIYDQRKLEYIVSIFGDDYQMSSNGELLYHCPYCPEKGHRNDDRKLYVNANKLKYICFRCETRGSLRRKNTSEFSGFDALEVLSEFLGCESDKKEKDDEEDSSYFRISPDKLVDYKDSQGYLYMKSRGFTDEMMDMYSLRLPRLKDNLNGRVVIPNQIISKNWTDMYVARTYIGSDQRYKNPVSSQKSHILFNYHRIKENPESIILNEGALNSIIAGTNSVASYGKSISDEQIQMILDKNPKKVYVSFDSDAYSKSVETCEKLLSRSRSTKVYLVELPLNESEEKNLDAVDLGRDRYLDIVYNSKEFTGRRSFELMSLFDLN